jgi:hypothetical protein
MSRTAPLTAERALFAVLLLLHLAPLAVCPVFPSQDGASHLEAAFHLAHYGDADGGLVRSYYVRNPSPEPNVFGHALLIALMTIVRPIAAEKLMLAAYVLALPLAARYALRAVAPDAGWLSVLVFPFVYSWPLHMGFYNFCWGLPLFLVVLGFWIRRRRAMTAPAVIGLAVLALLLWTAHVVPLVLALTVVALWLVVERAPLRGWASALVAFLPVLALLSFFIWRKQPVPSDRPPLADLGRALLQLSSLVSFRLSETIVTTALAALFAAAVLVALRGRDRRSSVDALLLAAAVFVLIYFAAPRRIAGGAYLNERLMLFPFLALLLWLGGQPFPPFARRGVQGAGAILSLALLGLHLATFVELGPQLAEMLSVADRLAPRRTLLPLAFAPEGWGFAHEGPRVRVFLHAASYLAVERGLVNLANYEGNYVHFPLIFRDEVNPFVQLAAEQGLEGEPPCADLEAWNRATGRPIDYILLWGLRGRRLDGEPCANRMLDQIDREYEVTYVSERRLVRLFERRGRTVP